MAKNLIFCAVGDNSLHHTWLSEKKIFDLMLVYYGDDDSVADKYEKQAAYFYRKKSPSKFVLLQSCIEENEEIFNKYEYVWAPDDDIESTPEDIETLFKTSKKYKLWLSQPGISGFVSYSVTRRVEKNILRYTDFVEVMAPCFEIKKLFLLSSTFGESVSAWGLDYLWPHILGMPEDKIAIIDCSNVNHTKEIGNDYSRFAKHPKRDLEHIKEKYKELFGENKVPRAITVLNTIENIKI